jgi:hypothetical protein
MKMNYKRETDNQFSPIWFALFFVGIGILCVVLGVVNYIHEEAFFASAEEDTATLVEYVRNPDYKSSGYCPKYQFTTKAGKTINYIGEACSSRPDPNTIGQKEKAYIDPRIDPRMPQDVETRGWTGSEGSGLIMGIIGLVFFSFIGLLSYVLNVLKNRRAPSVRR